MVKSRGGGEQRKCNTQELAYEMECVETLEYYDHYCYYLGCERVGIYITIYLILFDFHIKLLSRDEMSAHSRLRSICLPFHLV